MDLTFLKNDITTFELALKYGIHSSNLQSALIKKSRIITDPAQSKFFIT